MKYHFGKKTLVSMLTALLLSTISLHLNAQEPAPLRPVMTTWSIGLGSSHTADTYLSPLKYTGWSSAIDYERLQRAKWGNNNWVTDLKLSAELNRGINPAKNATMWSTGFMASWGMMRRWSLPYGFSGGIGPAIQINAGCIYNARNSNNPASAKGAITLDASAFIARAVKIGHLPVVFNYRADMPVIGAFFSPKYDELYYEIYLGNHSGLVHPAWFGNRFKFDNTLTADLWFGSTALRLGYQCNWMSSRVSNITTRAITHRFIIGVTLNRISVTPSKKAALPLL